MFLDEEYDGEKFRDLSFSGEELRSVRFYDCAFEKCDFSETAFVDCRFSGCSFRSCNLTMVRIVDAEFAHATFVDCSLVGVNWTEAYWPKLVGAGALVFDRCAISHSTFIGLSLPKSRFRDCAAKNVNFREADLTGADLSGTDFSESLFWDSNLAGADFTRSSGYAIDPGNNRIRGAKFSLPEATSLLYHMGIEIAED